MKSVNLFSDEIPAKSVLFLVDACYGGLAAVGQYRATRDLDIVKGLTKDRSRQIITAGKKDEEVVENGKWEWEYIANCGGIKKCKHCPAAMSGAARRCGSFGARSGCGS